MATTGLRSCNICEAGCGLVLEVNDNRIVSVQPDENDPQSHGFVCPKGMAIADVHHDPDRLHRVCAAAHAGISANDFADDQHVESVVGQSILNGVPVRLRRVHGEPDQYLA